MKYILFLLFLTGIAWAREVIPPVPQNYVVDESGVFSKAQFQALNQKLEDFEKQTSNQVVVAIYPKMLSDSSIEDYTVRIAQQWKVGQAKQDNGVILFVFTQTRKLYIQVGYGLEGALPDLLCHQIIQNEIVPWFKQGKYDRGIEQGIESILKATQGEYRGTGKTVRDQKRNSGSPAWFSMLFIVVVIFIILRNVMRGSYQSYQSRGYSTGSHHWGWGGGGGGGGFSSGGGGSFGGGGGSFGGGGSGGSW